MNIPTPPSLPAPLQGVERYAPPTAATTIRLKLDANEGAPIPANALADLLASLAPDASRRVQRYPDPADLERALAARFAVDPSSVILTTGGDDAIDRIARACLAPGRRAIVTTPTFEMIPRAARAARAEVVELPWLDGPPPIDAMLAAAHAPGAPADLIALVTPNNPTGAWCTPADLTRLLDHAAPTPVLVDLAYAEYADDDLTPVALAHSNAILVRTLSKAWGLAGLRIGCAIAAPPWRDRVRAVCNPYPVGGLAAALALAWLDRGCDWVAARVARVRAERDALAPLLRTLAGQPLPSRANFIAARFPDAWALADALAALGVGVRRFRRDSPFANYLRITCPGDEREFADLARALRHPSLVALTPAPTGATL
jgi:histidinol-phosphate aminotransferase